MTNEEKARQIAECCSVMPPTPITQSDVLAMTNNAAMQAMQWKEQQLIEKAKSNCFDYEAEIAELLKYIVWLKKQGEQKEKQYDIDILEKHITKDSISDLAHTVIIRNGWDIVDAKEQNPTWSDEGEKMMQCINKYVKASASNFDYQNIQIWFRNTKKRLKGE